jgi:hypothetical protein
MPLPDHRGLVTRLPELHREKLLLGSDLAVEVENPISLGVLPGDDAGPGGRADRVVGERAGEAHPASRQRIDVGCRIEPGQAPPVGPDGLGGVVVGHDEQDVRASLLRGVRGRGQRPRDGERDGDKETEASCFHGVHFA